MGTLRSRARKRWAHRDDAADESGFVVLWMIIVLVLLLSVSAFSVDLVHAYSEAERAQNAADAAALAGAAMIPASLDDSAPSGAAAQLAHDNLGTDYVPSEVTYTRSGPNEVTVTVAHKFDTYFAKVMGFDNLTVKRKAIAQYDPPLSMGSPANNLGDVPGTSCTDLGFGPYVPPAIPCANVPANATQNLYAQIQGPNTAKRSGNPFTTDFCSATTDGCSGTGSGTNLEYPTDPNLRAEYFLLNNDDTTSPMMISVYDGGFVDTGGFCNTGSNAITNADVLRYQTNSPYCAGDVRQAGLSGAGVPFMDTTYEVFLPDNDHDPTNNTVHACPPVTIPGEGPNNGTPIVNPVARSYFQQWKPLCTRTDSRREWVVKVSSSSGHGTNGFSLLALHGTGLPPTINGDLAVHTQQKLPLFATKPGGGPAEFYLARVLPSSRERTLEVDLFDLGDSQCSGVCSTDRSGTISIFPEGGSAFPGCEVLNPVSGFSQSSPGPAPWGNFGAPASCANIAYDGALLAGANSWNGQWVTVRVPIPKTYACTVSDFNSCWVKIEVRPSATAPPLSDATSWNVRMLGAPVRLVG